LKLADKAVKECVGQKLELEGIDRDIQKKQWLKRGM